MIATSKFFKFLQIFFVSKIKDLFKSHERVDDHFWFYLRVLRITTLHQLCQNETLLESSVSRLSLQNILNQLVLFSRLNLLTLKFIQKIQNEYARFWSNFWVSCVWDTLSHMSNKIAISGNLQSILYRIFDQIAYQPQGKLLVYVGSIEQKLVYKVEQDWIGGHPRDQIWILSCRYLTKNLQTGFHAHMIHLRLLCYDKRHRNFWQFFNLFLVRLKLVDLSVENLEKFDGFKAKRVATWLYSQHFVCLLIFVSWGMAALKEILGLTNVVQVFASKQ